jgi:20S proteasome alpha/beta subunit
VYHQRADLDALIHHALQALQDCLPNDSELSLANTEIAIVGPDTKFSTVSDQEVFDHE